MNKLGKVAVALAMAFSIVWNVSAKDRFVSKSGTWIKEGMTGECFTDIAKAASGMGSSDTIWVESGYVYEPTSVTDRVALNNNPTGAGYGHFELPNTTLRSEYGDARTDPNPPILRGRLQDPEATEKTAATTLGADAIRAVINKGTIIGFVFENGACINSAGYGGGAAYGSGRLTKCVIRNCYGPRGVVNEETLRECVVSNNTTFGHAVLYGCHVYDSLITGNTASDGGAVGYISNRDKSNPFIISNCTMTCNTSTGGGGALAFASAGYKCYAKVMDCVISNNCAKINGGGANGWMELERCRIVDNVVSNSNGTSGGGCCGLDSGDHRMVLRDCIVSGNAARSWNADHRSGGGEGGGLKWCDATDTVISNNYGNSYGGGASGCKLLRCAVVDNLCTNYEGYTYYNAGYGGGVYYGSATNCLIAGNRVYLSYPYRGSGGGAAYANLVNCTVTNNYASNMGGGYYGDGSCYNTLFADNRAGSNAGGVETLRGAPEVHCLTYLYNCTVTGNTGLGVRGVIASNTISWGNETTDTFDAATNCCSSVLTDATKYPGCIARDPRLTADYRPGVAVRNKGLYFSWMDDEADPRSKDLAGNPRLQGDAPDLGCYEPIPLGLMLLVK